MKVIALIESLAPTEIAPSEQQVHFRLVLHESASYSRGQEYTQPALYGRKGMPASLALRQLLQQRFGLLEVSRVKPLSEPAIEWRQQHTRFGLLALLLPEATEA